MVTTFVAIPTLGRSPLLWPLLDMLAADETVAAVWVYDNGVARDVKRRLDERASDRLVVVDAHGIRFYGMWNEAIHHAKEHGEANLALLNDDIRIPPRAVAVMAETVRSQSDLWAVCPDYRRTLSDHAEPSGAREIRGTYRQGGLAGFCFMVRAEVCPYVDEQFEIWYGDDDLVAKIADGGGKIAMVEGLPVEHAESTTLNQCDWTVAARERDAVRWAARSAAA